MHDSRRTRLVLAVLLVAAVAMITINYQDGSSSPLSGLNGFGNTVFGPVEHAAGAALIEKVTVPVGVGGDTPVPATVALKVTALPTTAGDAELDVARVVVPLPCSVRFSWLFEYS